MSPLSNASVFEVAPSNTPDYDAVPGTVYLISGSHEAGADRDVLLLPVPSPDFRDPLVCPVCQETVCGDADCRKRWSSWRKAYHLFLLVSYSSLLGAVTNWESVIYLNLVQEYQTPISNLNIGSAVTLLLLGVGNVFFIPLSNKLGRRSIYTWTLILVLVSEIWMAFSKTIGHYQGAHVLMGIGAAPFEALVPISISDVYFAHERGSKLGAYVFGLAFGSFIGPLCAGYMAVNQGWRWIYRWGAILTGALLLLFFFTFEESRFDRPAAGDEGRIVSLEHAERAPSTSSSVNEKKPVDGEELQREVTQGPVVGEIFETDHWRPQVSFWRTSGQPWRETVNDFWRPLQTAAFPAVVWCGINYGTCVSWLAVMATTIAEVFARPPYLFSNSDLGLIWIAPMIGSLFGAYFSGPLNDRLMLYLSNRNKGWREPEFRLWASIPSAIIMPCGLIMYGVTAAHGLHWVIPIVGTGFVGFGLSVGGAISIAYIVDCYKDIDTHVVTTIILIRNVVGFAITWGIQPWIDAMGQQNAFILVGVLSFVITGFAVVFIGAGKRMRRLTAAQYGRLAKQTSSSGL